MKQELPEMSDDDLLPPDLVIADDKMEVDQADAAAASKQKLMDTLSFSFPGGSLANALAKVCRTTKRFAKS